MQKFIEQNSNKYSMFPIKYKGLWEAFETHHKSFWTIKDVDLSQDLGHLKDLSKDELHYITHVLAFFAQSDGIVNENLAVRFYDEVEIPEARAFYADQIQREAIHSWMYSLLIDTYVKDPIDKQRLFNAIESVPAVKKKAEWALKWISSNEDLVKRLVAFAIVEGVFFSGSFCAIFWFRKRGLLPGLATANNWISRDEGMHWEFAVLLYHTLGLKISPKDFGEIMMDAVEIEKEFVRDALPVGLIGMNADLMCQYIEYMADLVSRRFGFASIYEVENPFDFMRMNDMETKVNFFEKRVSEYSHSESSDLSLNADF
jgi:ribonucleoside-diphosphate reductase beta chain